MTPSKTIDLIQFIQPLFTSMRRVGMPLSLDDFSDLRNAIAQSYGLGGWDDLRLVCELLWVKPSPDFSQEKFDRGFQQFQLRFQRSPAIKIEDPALNDSIELGKLPSIPPRKSTTTDSAKTPEKVLKAIEVGGLSKPTQPRTVSKTFDPLQYPVSFAEIRRTWSVVRGWGKSTFDLELDLDRTIEKIQTEGWWSDVVLKPITVKRAELIFLVDDSAVMRPSAWAVQPFYQAIQSGVITPGQIYSFSGYPIDTLFTADRPRQKIPLDRFLTHCHQDRTIVIIWSDAGSILNLLKQQYIQEIENFLIRLAPCIHQLYWLNPLPEERWQRSSARWVDQIVNGKMIPLQTDWGRLMKLTRLNQVVIPQ